MLDNLDPTNVALLSLVAVCFTALGAILTGSTDTGLSIAERGTVLGGIVAVLAGVAYFGRRRGPGA